MSRPSLRAAGLVLIALALPSLAAAQVTAFVGGRVFDGTGTVIEAGTVVVRDGRIAAVGPASQVQVPAGATRVELAGKTLMPGLVNAHGHVAATSGLESDPRFYTRDNLLRQLRTYADYGVTTVYSLGDDQQAGFDLRDEQDRGPLTRARLYVAGPVIGGATAEEAAAMADRVAAMKPDLLKIRVDDNLGTSRKMPEAAWRAVLDRARAHGLRLAVHVFYQADAQALADAGSTFIAHSVRDVPVNQRFVDTLKQKNVCYSPTFTRELSTFAYDSTPVWVDEPFFLRGAEPGVAAALKDPARQAAFKASRAYEMGRKYRTGLEVAQRNLKVLSDQGVRIAFGTDTGPPARFQGFFEHLELEMMVQAGLTPMQALVSATSQAAQCHGAKDLGVIAPGARADLLVLAGNPLADIRATRSIEAVYLAGRALDRK
jgi:imidazolonepropionase-like amidohydrolase